MIALLARRLALMLFLAFLVVALLEQFNPAPPPLLVDFHRAAFHRALQPFPDDAHPVLQHCYPVAPQSDEPSVVIGSSQEPLT